MPVALAIFAVFFILVSGSAALFPSEALAWLREVVTGHGLWYAAAGRLVLAVLLWFSAPTSRTPVTFKVLAGLALLGAVAVLIIGTEGMHQIIDWFASLPLWTVRLQSTAGLAFGAFLLWSLSGKWASQTKQDP